MALIHTVSEKLMTCRHQIQVTITKKLNTTMCRKKLQADHIKLGNFYTKRCSAVIAFDIKDDYFNVHEAMKIIVTDQINDFDIVGYSNNNMSEFISSYASVHGFDIEYEQVQGIVSCTFTANSVLKSLTDQDRGKIYRRGILSTKIESM